MGISSDCIEPPAPPTVWTVGHSTHSAEVFLDLLISHRIRILVDVRSYPASRRYPHFNRSALAESLRTTGIAYHHLVELGGRRKPSSQSRNIAWRNPSFQAYADHMESEDFRKGINILMKLAGEKPTAIMCAESVWWRCHRSLIADYLKSLGSEVIHIIDATRTAAHPYTAAARIINGKLSYAGLL